MVMVNLTTGITLLLLTFGCGKFYEAGPRVRRPPMKWSVIVERLRNTGLKVVNCAQSRN
jgi:hypothetical protein